MTVAEFRALYPQFSTVDDAVIQQYLDLFSCIFGHLDFSCQESYLTGLFVAHRLTIWSKQGAVTMVATSKSVGDVSVSGQVPGMDGSYGDYGATGYGIEFWNTISLFGAGGMMAEPYYG